MVKPPATVVLIGAESTGKTTLAAQLAEHYGVEWCPEYAREFAEGKKGPLDSGDVQAIAEGQLALEDEHLRRGGELLLFDTNILSTIVYSNYYYEGCPEWIEAAFRDRSYGLYLLLDTDAPWAADPVRDAPDSRFQIHGHFKSALRERDCRHVEIRGDWTRRFERAVSEIEVYLRSIGGRS